MQIEMFEWTDITIEWKCSWCNKHGKFNIEDIDKAGWMAIDIHDKASPYCEATTLDYWRTNGG